MELFQTCGRLFGKNSQTGEDFRLGFDISAVIHFRDGSAAPFCHHLFGIEDGIVFKFGKAAGKGLQTLLSPELSPHKLRISFALLIQQRLQCIEPAGIQACIPLIVCGRLDFFP